MAGTFPPDYFGPDYFGSDYFGGEADPNAMSAALAGTSSVTGTLGAASSAPTFSPITFSNVTFSARTDLAVPTFSPITFSSVTFSTRNVGVLSASLAGTSSLTAELLASTAPTFSPITFSSVTFSTRDEESPPVALPRPVGGSWVNPTYVKDRKRKRKGVDREDLEEIYNRILGLVPDEPTKAQQRVVAKVAKAIGQPEAVELPPAGEVDFAAIEAKAARALREAYERLLEDDDEAVIAYLLAA